MTHEEQQQFEDHRATVKRWLHDWHRLANYPGDSYRALYAILSNLAAQVSDADWQEMVLYAGVPCPRPGCECHVFVGKLFGVLDELRRHHARGSGEGQAMREDRN